MNKRKKASFTLEENLKDLENQKANLKDEIEFKSNHVTELQELIEEKDMKISNGINIILDNIRDPGNLGTIIRTCDWFNVHNIYCSCCLFFLLREK